MKTSVKTNIISAAATLPLQYEMWQLYLKYYKTEKATFLQRFSSNDYYAVYRKDDQLVGFTGFRMREIETGFGKVQTLYIGQTVIDSNFRGNSFLPKTCCKLFLQHYLTKPLQPIYVWCDALTYKPYLLFANSVKKFYPSREIKNSPKVKAILNNLGQSYYGENYDCATGTVKKESNVILDATAKISDKHLEHPDIAFFAQSNPKHIEGHGLLTIAPINFSNFLFLVKKCMKKSWWC